MTEGQTPEGEPTPASEPTPMSDPPPLAPYVQPAAAESPTMSMATPAPAPAAPPPPVAWAAPPAVVAVKGGRTMLAGVAGVGLIVLGVLGILFGLAIAVFGASVVNQLDLGQYGDFGDINNPAAVISGAIAFIGIVVALYSLVYLIGGIGVVRSRGWGRVMGLVVGILSGAFWLLSLTGSSSSTGAGNGIGFVLVMLAIHAYIV
ncbi:MAG: hypothetical protein ABI620_09890, partial [Chloroflexota bacterium]